MEELNFYIVLIIATLAFALLSGGAIFQGSLGPTPSKDLFVIKPQTNSLTGKLPGTTPAPEPKRYFSIPSASVYQGKVRISYISKAGTNNEVVALYAFPTVGSSVTIDGWKLRSTITGNQIVVDGVGELPYINANTEWKIDTAFQSGQPLWLKRGDNIQLIDNAGKLVDVFSN